MKYIIYLTIVLLILSGCSRHSIVRFNTKEDLVGYYIKSVNSKDIELLKKAYHPQLLKMITDDNADFFNDFFAKELSRSIPSDSDVSYQAVGDSNDAGLGNLIFMFKDAFDYPIAPTLVCEIDYNESEYSSVTKFLYLSDTRDGWFLVFGIPKQQTLVQYRDAKNQKDKGKSGMVK